MGGGGGGMTDGSKTYGIKASSHYAICIIHFLFYYAETKEVI